MSGCAYCVYDIYAEELEAYTEAIKAAKAKLTERAMPTSQWPIELQPQSGGAREITLEESLDPSMAAFLAYVLSVPTARGFELMPRSLENKLKKKQAPESSGASA